MIGLDRLAEVRKVAVLQVVAKVRQRPDAAVDLQAQGLVLGQHLLQRPHRKGLARLQLQILAERQPAHRIHHRPARQVRLAVLEMQRRRAREHHLQIEGVVDALQLAFEIGVVVDLVEHQQPPALLAELVGQGIELDAARVDAVEAHIQRAAQKIGRLTDELQQEGRLPHPARAQHAGKTLSADELAVKVAPVGLVEASH